MKRTFQVLVLAVLCLLGTDTFAQKIKLGHFNSNELMQKMPEAKQAETQLQEYVADLQAEMELMSQEYNRLTEEYEAKKDQLTDLLKQNKQKEIMSVAERMQAFDRQSQISIQEKQVELMNVIVEKIKTAVAEVAAENGYTYIFESNGILWYSTDSDDITSLLEAKLLK
ncbi:MAG: OmpH family outer membrane protein [Bacteroidales bacterium]|nr:OmpH family outer membrane protein [Bacteroidales bacterium]MEE0889650.1 OmpH family outer membrane protein [Bacteroidales bacterium]MEE1322335.1 OmpH family outer membrane protein [Bacteroidales bacterium]